MSPHFKIVIPKPCNEDWDKMTPDATGRFCLACNKSVIDFTNKMPEEIQHFFLKNQDKEICGRFKNSQLDAVSIQIPSRVLFSQTQYHKMFLLALFVVMGTSLFSCATVNGDKQKIKKVEVVDEQKYYSSDIKGIEQLKIEDERKEDSYERNSMNNVPIDHTKHLMGAISPITTIRLESEMFSLPKNENKKIFFLSIPDIKHENSNNIKNNNLEAEPYFPEGITAFYAFFAKEFKMPENTKLNQSIIVVKIKENGSVTYVRSSPYINKTIEEEIIRVLKLSPKWEPGKSNGLDVSKESFLILEVK